MSVAACLTQSKAGVGVQRPCGGSAFKDALPLMHKQGHEEPL